MWQPVYLRRLYRVAASTFKTYGSDRMRFERSSSTTHPKRLLYRRLNEGPISVLMQAGLEETATVTNTAGLVACVASKTEEKRKNRRKKKKACPKQGVCRDNFLFLKNHFPIMFSSRIKNYYCGDERNEYSLCGRD